MSKNVAEVADRAGRRVRRKVQIPRVISHIVWTFDRPLTFIGEGIVNETPLQCESCNWLFTSFTLESLVVEIWGFELLCWWECTFITPTTFRHGPRNRWGYSSTTFFAQRHLIFCRGSNDDCKTTHSPTTFKSLRGPCMTPEYVENNAEYIYKTVLAKLQRKAGGCGYSN